MAVKDAFVRTLREMASLWRCPLVASDSQTKFILQHPEMPTSCTVYAGLKPAKSWDREEFGDFVRMRWERFLGKITKELDPYSLLIDDYKFAPPFYAITEVEGVPGLFLVDYYHFPWTAEDSLVAHVIASRYAMGLTAEPISGVILQFNQFDSIFS
jgi:hypothetical protein